MLDMMCFCLLPDAVAFFLVHLPSSVLHDPLTHFCCRLDILTPTWLSILRATSSNSRNLSQQGDSRGGG